MRNRYLLTIIYMGAVTFLSSLSAFLLMTVIPPLTLRGEVNGVSLSEGYITFDLLLGTGTASLFIIVLTLLLWRWRGWKLSEIGIRGEGNTGAILEGAGAALFLVAPFLSLLLLLGVFKGFEHSPRYEMGLLPETLLTLLLLAVYASCEEFMMRGFVLNTFLMEGRFMEGISVSTLLFALLHIKNPNIDIWGLSGIFLTGLLLALMYLKRGNLFLPISFHTSWNFLNFVLGLPVSGVKFSIYSPFTLILSPGRLSGNDFGWEGSPLFHLLIFLFILLYLFHIRRARGHENSGNR